MALALCGILSDFKSVEVNIEISIGGSNGGAPGKRPPRSKFLDPPLISEAKRKEECNSI